MYIPPYVLFTIGLLGGLYLWTPKAPERPRPRPTYDDLKISLLVNYDYWNKMPDSEVTLYYRDSRGVEIAHANARLGVGQIGWITIHDEFGHYSKDGQLRRRILFDIVCLMKGFRTPPETVWEALVYEDDEMYSALGFRWLDPAHNSVTSPGWSIRLDRLRNPDLVLGQKQCNSPSMAAPDHHP